MKVRTRQISVSKSIEETIQILKSCAYYFPKTIFEKSAFSMCCPKRRNGVLSLIRVKGSVSEDEKNTSVELEIHANLYFFVGCVILLGGLIGLLYGLVSNVDSCIFYLGVVLMGLLAIGDFIGISSELLDLLEHKLTS